MRVLTDGITGLSCHERSHTCDQEKRLMYVRVPCQPRWTESLCAPTFGVAQAATHMTNAVDGRPSDTHTRRWYIRLAWA